MLQKWDRSQGLLLQSRSSEEQLQELEEAPEAQGSSGKRAKKEREKEKLEQERQEKTKAELLTPPPSQVYLLPDDTEASERELALEVIPLISVFVGEKELLSVAELMNSLKLPSLEEVV